MKKARKKFIKRAHEAACSNWKTEIEKEFPKLFKSKFEKGDWYFSEKYEKLMKFKSIENLGERNRIHFFILFTSNISVKENDYLANTDMENSFRKATHEEIEKVLIEEAKERGFKNGVKYSNVGFNRVQATLKDFEELRFYINGDHLTDGHGGSIYSEGQWAEIITPQYPESLQKAIDTLGIEEIKKLIL